MTRSTSMPISSAASLSSETARMALPILVRWTTRYRATIINNAPPITTNWVLKICNAKEHDGSLQRLHRGEGLEAGSVQTAKNVLQEE